MNKIKLINAKPLIETELIVMLDETKHIFTVIMELKA